MTYLGRSTRLKATGLDCAEQRLACLLVVIVEEPDGQCRLALDRSLGNRAMLGEHVPLLADDRKQISVALGTIEQEVMKLHHPARAAARQQGAMEYPMQFAKLRIHPATDHDGNARQSV